MAIKPKNIIIISALLLGILPFGLSAFSWHTVEPYSLSIVLVCSFGALLLAHISIVKLRRYQRKLEQSEEQLRLSLWGSGDELWDWKISSGKLYRSSTWLNPVEFLPDADDFPPNKQQIHPQDQARVSLLLQQHLDGKTDYFEATYRLKTTDQSWTWVLDRGKVVAFADNGKPSRMTGTLKNIQQLKQTEEQLQLFARCLHNISDAVIICDTDLVILDVNPSFSKITGKQRQDVLQQRFELTLYPSRFMQEIRKKLAENGSWTDEIEEQRQNGEVYQAELTIDQIKDEQGHVSQYVAVFSDITERKLREAELHRLASNDTLTGLPNRTIFMQRLRTLVDSRSEHALLVFDLDNFKKINDSLGHELGDKLLCKLASRLSLHSSYRDKLFRLGGDEFAVLLEQTNDLAFITAIAKDLLAQINQPIQVQRHDLAITSSIGIVLFPDDGADPQALLRNADTAMYHAKSQGANRYLFFNDSMNKQAVKRLQIENLIRYGLKEDYFVVHYQPKMDIATGQLLGMEALVRFNTPQGGLVSPASFIPVAEETGQILEIGEVVLRKACRDVKGWIDQGLFHGRVAVNLSSRQFSLPFLCELIDDTLQQTELPSYHLELEITEGTVMQSPPQAIETMKKLRARGIHLAMDDFGTGYSSLAYLKQFPLNTLKIDKAFIDDMNNARGRNMVDTIMTIAHNLNLSVVAEGVEQQAQLDMLRKLRCDVIQGYYYSKPLNATEFYQFLLQQKKQHAKLTAVAIN